MMKRDMKEILDRVLNHEELTREETKDILIGITRSEYPAEQVTALLTGLQMRGVTVDELLGFRDGILETQQRPASSSPGQATRWPSTATTPPRAPAERRT